MKPPASDTSKAWRSVDDDPERKAQYLELLTSVMNHLKTKVSDQLRLQPGQTVLEIGCGLGRDTEYMAGQVGSAGRAVGLDFSAELIAQAKARTVSVGPHLHFEQGDATALPFASDSFDAARVERTLQHLPEAAKAVAELARVVRSGGRIVAFEPDWDTVIVSAGAIDVGRVIRSYKTDIISEHGAIGRDMPWLLVRAGCAVISTESISLALPSLSTADPALGLRANLDRAVGAGLITEAAGREWWDEAVRRDEAGAFVASITGIMVTALAR